MGWFAYRIYGGDDTHTRHIDFAVWGKLITKKEKDDFQDKHLLYNKTKLSEEHKIKLRKNIDLILKKMPKNKYLNEDVAIEWQMLLALFVDNNLKPPKIVKDKGIEATEYLMAEDASCFDNPSARRRCLRIFLEKAKKI